MTHPENSAKKIGTRELSVSLGVIGVEVNRLVVESNALLQVRRSVFISKKIALEARFIGLRVDLARRSGEHTFRIHQLMNLTGDALCYLGLQLQDVTQVAFVPFRP